MEFNFNLQCYSSCTVKSVHCSFLTVHAVILILVPDCLLVFIANDGGDQNNNCQDPRDVLNITIQTAHINNDME